MNNNKEQELNQREQKLNKKSIQIFGEEQKLAKQKRKQEREMKANGQKGNGHRFYQFRREITPQMLYILSKHPLALRILSILMYISNEDGAVAIEQKYLRHAIATVKGSSESNRNSTVNSIKFMQKMGILTVERRDVRNIYILNPEFIWRLKDNPVSRGKVENNVCFEHDPAEIEFNKKLNKKFKRSFLLSYRIKISELIGIKKIREYQTNKVLKKMKDFNNSKCYKRTHYLTVYKTKSLNKGIRSIIDIHNKLKRNSRKQYSSYCKKWFKNIKRTKGIQRGDSKNAKDENNITKLDMIPCKFYILPCNYRKITNYLDHNDSLNGNNPKNYHISANSIIQGLYKISKHWQVVKMDSIDIKFISLGKADNAQELSHLLTNNGVINK